MFLTEKQIRLARFRLWPTLGSQAWVFLHQKQLRELVPAGQGPRPLDSLLLPAGFRLKVLGVNWQEESDIFVCFLFFCYLGWAEVSDIGGGKLGITRI